MKIHKGLLFGMAITLPIATATIKLSLQRYWIGQPRDRTEQKSNCPPYLFVKKLVNKDQKEREREREEGMSNA